MRVRAIRGERLTEKDDRWLICRSEVLCGIRSDSCEGGRRRSQGSGQLFLQSKRAEIGLCPGVWLQSVSCP